MRQTVIEAANLTKTFAGEVVAVSGLDLQVERGTVYGLIGRNGAGKTTTLRLLMGLLTPSQGTAEILGQDLRTASLSERSRVAYVSQSQQLPGWMTLNELCRYASHFYPKWDFSLAVDLARRWDLNGDRSIAQLSGGEQRKAAILVALAPRPEVLLLDEPAAGLDPAARRELINELIDLLSQGHGCTVLFSTHILSDLERIAEWVGILDRGRLLVNGRLDELQSRMQRVQIIFPGDAPPLTVSIPGAVSCQVSGPVVTAVTQLVDAEHLESIRRWPGVRVQVFPLGLEEIFIEMVGRGNGEKHPPSEIELLSDLTPL
ncbi:MAG: ABC transporter ATP-binding protein [Verrucomicrobiota bacterium]